MTSETDRKLDGLENDFNTLSDKLADSSVVFVNKLETGAKNLGQKIASKAWAQNVMKKFGKKQSVNKMEETDVL